MVTKAKTLMWVSMCVSTASFLFHIQGEDIAHSQEDSLLALQALRSDQHQPLSEPSRGSSDIDFPNTLKNATKANPYLGLYSDELPPALLGDQSEENQQLSEEAQSQDDARGLASRGSDRISESQSVAEESASNDYGAEGFAEDEF